jgi:hypothetical protein
MALDIITTVVEAAETYDLTTLANVKLDLGIPTGVMFTTSADTPSGQVLPFLATYGITKGKQASGDNIVPGCTVQLVGPDSCTLSAAIMGDIPAGTQITFGDDAAADTFLTRAITLSSMAMQNYCGRKFAVETIQDEFIWTEDHNEWQEIRDLARLQLSKGPLISVTSVVVDEDGTEVTLEEGMNFIIDQDKAQLIRIHESTGRPSRWRGWNTTVIYTAGYATLPADIDDACSRMTKKAYWARGRDPSVMEISQGSLGSTKYWVATTPDGNLPPEICDILDKYRSIVIA